MKAERRAAGREPAARSAAAEADKDEFRAGIHNDRSFGSDFNEGRGQVP